MNKPEIIHGDVQLAPFAKKIGKKTYIVESFFDDNARLTLDEKIKRLIDKDLEAEKTLLSRPSGLTSNES